MTTSASTPTTAPEVIAAPVEVAVGLVRDATGRLLITQRQAHQPFAGLWEFPGGKLEPGESPGQALVREFAEEVGLRVVAARPLLQLAADGPAVGGRIRLHVFEVGDWRGQPRSLEGQQVRWAAPDEIETVPMPPANRAMRQALTLPRYAAITPPDWHRQSPPAVPATPSALIVLRLPQAEPKALAAAVERLDALATANPALRPVCSSRHAGTSLPRHWGVHLTAAELVRTRVRPAAPLVGASCHDAAALAHAARLGCDYAFLSPVRTTTTHPDRPPLGVDGLAALLAGARLPVYALGGMCPADEAFLRGRGVFGVAGIGAFWNPALRAG